MKQIKNYENYFISEEGRVFRNNKEIKFSVTNKGYCRLTLYNNNIPKTFSVHRLVGEHYLFNINKLSIINHIDGNKVNNHKDNLEWCTNSYNLKHAYKLGLKSASGSKNGRAKLTEEQVKEIKILLSQGIKNKEIADKFSISKSVICDIKHKRKWSHINL